MRRLLVAIKTFFSILTGSIPVDAAASWTDAGRRPQAELEADDKSLAADRQLGDRREGEVSATSRDTGGRTSKSPARGATRSDAITLLATLQREARWVDLVQENLDEYSDAEVGAAARDVLRHCRGVLERLFDLHALVEHEEGIELETPSPLDPGRWQLSGRVEGEAPYRGRLVHHGWEARQVQLPQWSGSAANERVVAPVEIEVQ